MDTHTKAVKETPAAPESWKLVKLEDALCQSIWCLLVVSIKFGFSNISILKQ